MPMSSGNRHRCRQEGSWLNAWLCLCAALRVWRVKICRLRQRTNHSQRACLTKPNSRMGNNLLVQYTAHFYPLDINAKRMNM